MVYEIYFARYGAYKHFTYDTQGAAQFGNLLLTDLFFRIGKFKPRNFGVGLLLFRFIIKR